MPIILSFWNTKGGVAKTTTVAHLAAFLAAQGKSVLSVDLDCCHLTETLLPNTDVAWSIQDVLHNIKTLEQITVTVSEKHQLAPARMELNTSLPSEVCVRLSDQLTQFNWADYILIDCPSAMTLPTRAALMAADYLFIPCQPSFHSINGVQQAIEMTEQIRTRFHCPVQIGGIFLTLVPYHQQATLPYQQVLKDTYPRRMKSRRIRYEPSMEKIKMVGSSIFSTRGNERAKNDYQLLGQAIQDRLKTDAGKKKPSLFATAGNRGAARRFVPLKEILSF